MVVPFTDKREFTFPTKITGLVRLSSSVTLPELSSAYVVPLAVSTSTSVLTTSSLYQTFSPVVELFSYSPRFINKQCLISNV